MGKGMEQRVGIRGLKARLSEYLRDVKAGGTVVVTERGRPVARLVPEAETVEARLERLRRAGVLNWNGRRLEPIAPGPRMRGKRTIADIVVENRE